MTSYSNLSATCGRYSCMSLIATIFGNKSEGEKPTVTVRNEVSDR